MFKSIRNIVVGWYRKLTGKKEDFADNRLKICKRCSYRETFWGEDICSKCGCFLSAKVLVEDEICLDGRWPDVND